MKLPRLGKNDLGNTGHIERLERELRERVDTMTSSPRSSVFLCIGMLSLCAGTLPAKAETIYVDALATGAPTDGSTWCNAYLRLQDALMVASLGDEVHVANGVYHPDQGGAVVAGDRLASFRLADRVAIHGGYAGCGASNPDARDTALYQTILSGDLTGNDVAGFGNRSDNSYHVVVYDDPNATGSILEGFTVSGGHADGSGPAGTATNQGSGIHIRLDSQMCIPGGPTIRDCIVEDNWSSHHGAVNIHADQALIESCTIRNNHSDFRGGGLLIQSGNTTVRNCLISNNAAQSEGGGVWTGHSSEPTCAPTSAAVFDNCTIQDNYSNNLGGGLLDDGSSIVVRNSYFIGNSARAHGGGAWFGPLRQVEDTSASQPLITDTLFEDNFNTEVTYGEGGGAHVSKNQPTFARCTFRNNVSAHNGGGLWGGGTNAVVLLENCVWEGNSGTNGGGYYHRGENSRTTVRDGVFRDNQSTDDGGGMIIYGGAGLIERTTFESNISDFAGGGIYVNQDFVFATCLGEACITRCEDCTFRNNEAQFGGGIFAGYSPHLIMRRVVIENNRAVYSGGGGFFKGREGENGVLKGTPEAGWMRLEDCIFRDNVSDGSGGGVYVTGDATFAAIRTDFIDNTCLHSGAGMFVRRRSCADVYSCRFIGNFMPTSGSGAGIHTTTDSDLRVANSLFIANRSGNSGGAIVVDAGAVATVANTTIAYNESSSSGAAVYVNAGVAKLYNSIIWSNVTGAGGATLSPENTPSTLSVTASLVDGGFAGSGNFDADPQFIDPSGLDGAVGTKDDDLRLSLTSPAIDAADIAALPMDDYDMDGDGITNEFLPLDLAGEARIFGFGLDLGAFEVQVDPCPPGTFSVTGKDPCDPCPVGAFQPGTGETECFACDAGTFTATTGTAICSPCPADTFQPALGASECLACDCDDSDPSTADSCDEVTGSCRNQEIAIPAASTWSLICLALLLMSAATILMPRASGRVP